MIFHIIFYSDQMLLAFDLIGDFYLYYFTPIISYKLKIDL